MPYNNSRDEAPDLYAELRREFLEMGLATTYFAAWLGLLVTIKVLVLEEYHIRFGGSSAVVVGALVLAKVVLVLSTSRLTSGSRDALQLLLCSCGLSCMPAACSL